MLSLENDTIVPELPISCRNLAANVKSFVFLSCSAARWYTVVGKTRFRSPPMKYIIKTNNNLCINQLSENSNCNNYRKTMWYDSFTYRNFIEWNNYHAFICVFNILFARNIKETSFNLRFNLIHSFQNTHRYTLHLSELWFHVSNVDIV